MTDPHTGVGKSTEDVDAAQPDDSTFADALGFDLDDDDDDDDGESAPDPETGTEAVDPDDGLPSRDEMWAIIKRLIRENEQQSERISDLEETAEEQSEQIEELQDEREKREEAEERAEEAASTAREIAATVNAMQDEQDEQSGGDAETVAEALEASSPLDFFLNCQQYHVNQSINKNRARGVEVVRRREEFASVGRKNGMWIFEKDDVKEALVAILGEKPHRETIGRVWDYIGKMGGDDVIKTTIQPGTADSKREVIKIRRDADERFEERRYVGMNLLSGGNAAQTAKQVTQGGVTPVVTGVSG